MLLLLFYIDDPSPRVGVVFFFLSISPSDFGDAAGGGGCCRSCLFLNIVWYICCNGGIGSTTRRRLHSSSVLRCAISGSFVKEASTGLCVVFAYSMHSCTVGPLPLLLRYSPGILTRLPPVCRRIFLIAQRSLPRYQVRVDDEKLPSTLESKLIIYYKAHPVLMSTVCIGQAASEQRSIARRRVRSK